MPVSAATMLYYNGFGSGLGSASRQGGKHSLCQYSKMEAGLRDQHYKKSRKLKYFAYREPL